MALDEVLIRRVLSDARTTDFDTSPIFRNEIRNQPGAAQILVALMHDASPEIAARAKVMLCLFDSPALGALADGAARTGASFRAELLDVIVTIIGVSDPKEWAAQLGPILPRLVHLLRDLEVVDVPGGFKMEIEIRCRVCDLAYLSLQELRDPEFDGYNFLLMEFEERDGEVRALLARLGMLLA